MMALIKCPECGKEVSDKSETCIYCGCPIKDGEAKEQENEKNGSSTQNAAKQDHNKNRKKIIFVIVGCLAVILAVLCYFTFFYRGTFEISQANDTIELGASVKLTDFLEFDPQNIIQVNIINDNDFNTSRIGDYVVLFSVKNKRGYVEEKSFEFHVVDTVAPELTIAKDTVYIAKGSAYEPVDNAKASDKSDCTIEVSGTFDLDKEGTYDISFAAKDVSGNLSERKSMKLIVEDRDDCIFRNAKFGDSAEVVKRYETGELIDEGSGVNSYVAYSDLVESIEAYIMYHFNSQDELYDITVMFLDSHTDYGIFISEYEELSQKLTGLYGNPTAEEKEKGRLYKYCADDGEALQIGQVKYRSRWETDAEDILLYLGSDNYTVDFALLFDSKVFQETPDGEIH